MLFAENLGSGFSCAAVEPFRRHATHYLSVLKRIEELYLKGGEALKEALFLFDLEWPNIKVGHSWAMVNADRDVGAAELSNDYPLAAPHVLAIRLDPATMIEWRQLALSVARRSGYRQAESFHLGHLGLAYKGMGDFRRAIEFYLAELEIDREEKNERGELISLGNIGVAYKNLGEFERAAACVEESLSLARKIGDRRGEANALINLGIILKEQGHLESAIENYKRALSIQDEIGNVQGRLTALGNMAIAYKLLGELGETERRLQSLLEEARALGDRKIIAETWRNLGSLYRELKHYDQAMECYDASLRECRIVNASSGEAEVLFDRSQMLAEVGRLEDAKEEAAQALEIFRRLRHPRESDVLHKLDVWGSE